MNAELMFSTIVEVSLIAVCVVICVTMYIEACHVRRDIEKACRDMENKARRLEKETNEFKKTVKVEVSNSVLDYLEGKK